MIAPPTAEHLDVLCDVDGVLYPLPELFTPYAAERLGRELHLDTTNWEFYTEWGLGYDDFVELLGEGVRERKLWWTGKPYPDVVAGDRADPRRRAPHPRRDGSRRSRHRGRSARRHPPLARSPRHRRRHDHAGAGQDEVIARLGLDPASCVAVDDGPHHIDAFEQVGVFGILLDRWGSYRGDHLMAVDLDDVADIDRAGGLAQP